MVHTHAGDTLRRSTSKLGRQAQRRAKHASYALADMTDDLRLSARRAARKSAKQVRGLRRDALKSMRKHPIAWSSVALGAAAAIAAALLAGRSAWANDFEIR